MGRQRLSLLMLAASFTLATACGRSDEPAAAGETATACADIGIQLPKGFCATIFADKLGHVRHMVVARDGTLYANSAPGMEDEGVESGLIILKDEDGDGRAERTSRPLAQLSGGTGIALYQNMLFLEDRDRIRRYRLDPRTGLPADAGDIIVSGLPTEGDHFSHSIAIRSDGALFVNSGSATNACQADNRQTGSPGQTPCLEKQRRAGIWRFDARRTDQAFSPESRYASGIRNAVGLGVDGRGRLFATQHGRDQLHENWGSLYSAQQGQELPAEELIAVEQGGDYGWPECYYDPGKNRRVLAPEYGGDGDAAGLCSSRGAPIAAYPAHWAPNAVAIYEAAHFPAAYRGGAFIAFHGSWNRAPGPQQGFNIVFQPMKDGRPSGRYVLFADGLAGAGKDSGDAAYRPTGLAVGPDGALYISDDKQGRIWRVTYQGDADAPLSAAEAARPSARTAASSAAADRASSAGSDAAQIALGKRLYAGEIAGAPCAGCHGPTGQGSPVGPNLADDEWIWGRRDQEIRAVIAKGVPNPRRFAAPMPAGGGADLSDEQVAALSAYIRSLGATR